METDDILDFEEYDDSTVENLEVDVVELNRFIFLYIITLGIYGVWWQYKVWRLFKEKIAFENSYVRDEIMPVPRALFSVFFFHGLLERIKKFAHSVSYTETYSSGWLFALYLVISIESTITQRIEIDNIFLNILDLALGMTMIFSFIPPVKALNFALQNSKDYHVNIKKEFSTRQIVLSIIGGLLWILILIGLFLPDELID